MYGYVLNFWLITHPDPRLVKASLPLSRNEVMLRMLSGMLAADMGGGTLYLVHVGNLSLDADLKPESST